MVFEVYNTNLDEVVTAEDAAFLVAELLSRLRNINTEIDGAKTTIAHGGVVDDDWYRRVIKARKHFHWLYDTCRERVKVLNRNQENSRWKTVEAMFVRVARERLGQHLYEAILADAQDRINENAKKATGLQQEGVASEDRA